MNLEVKILSIQRIEYLSIKYARGGDVHESDRRYLKGMGYHFGWSLQRRVATVKTSGYYCNLLSNVSIVSYSLFRISGIITNELCWGKVYPIGRLWKIRKKVGKFFFIMGCYFWNEKFFRKKKL